MSAAELPPANAVALLYHFCRLQVPGLGLSAEDVGRHLSRTFGLHRAKNAPDAANPGWADYLNNLRAADWYLAVGCLSGVPAAWDRLFRARTGQGDGLFVDALRLRAARLYPRDDEKQESAVTEFWSHLLVSESEGSIPVLARYDGQRPLVPWLIRVFQNWHISRLRRHAPVALADEDIGHPLPADPADVSGRWHEAFCLAVGDWLGRLSETEQLILGLRLRYRLSQRAVARVLGVHEGTVSRQTAHLRERCLDHVAAQLAGQGWTGDNLAEFVRLEMGSLVLDQPRLAADRLAALLAARGLALDRPGQ